MKTVDNVSCEGDKVRSRDELIRVDFFILITMYNHPINKIFHK